MEEFDLETRIQEKQERLENRVQEKQEQLERALKKAEKYKEQLKTLKARAKTEERKVRTHKLIMAGVQLSALFEHTLELEEIYQVVNYLREQMKLGKFELVKKENIVQEEPKIEQEEKTVEEVWGFDGMFDF